MNRQDQFERVYAELTGREVEAIKAMRFRITEGYASPKISDAYRVFCASQASSLLEALEAAEVQMWNDLDKIEGEWGMGEAVEALIARGESPAITAARAAIALAKGVAQ